MDKVDLNINNYTFSTLFVLLILGGIIGLITFFFLLRYRKAVEVKFWLVGQLAASIWAITYAFEYAARNIESKIFWSKLSYLGIVYEAVSFMFFAFAFSSDYKYIKRKYTIPAYVFSTLIILSPFTNHFHHLHWISYSIDPETNATDYQYGPFFWVLVVCTYTQLLTGVWVVLKLYNNLPGYYKKQVLVVLLSSLFPFIGNLMYVFHLNPLPGFDWTPFSFLITGILIAFSISKFRMFDLVPFARNKLIDIIPDGIVVVDKSLRVADCNNTFLMLLNASMNEVVGKTMSELLPSRSDLIRDALGHEVYFTEMSIEINGVMQYFDLQVNSLFDYRKQQTGRLVIFKDVSRRVQSEEMTKSINIKLLNEIQEKEKLIQDLDAFSHTVAHDLKGMLGSVITASTLIQSAIDDLSKEEILEIVNLINLTATKTTHITKELLTLASVRQQEIEPVAVNMEMITRDALTRLQDMIDEKKAVISLSNVWYDVLGNKSWLEEVLINYISNAIKYGGNPPQIRITTELAGKRKVKYSVSDNGNGLSDKEMAMLFKKFARLDAIRAEGNGLGLSIVKRIIEKLGGEVGVYSKNISGEGSTFYFILPLAR